MTVLPERQRVLIVDEDPGCRALLDAVFVTSGFEVTATDSVLGASELIARDRPHVIVVDFALPYRSGASWLAQLRSNPATACIPVVILAALPDLLPRARSELAQAVVRKPFRTRALVETVQALCGGARVVDGGVAPEGGVVKIDGDSLGRDRRFRIGSASTQPLGSL